MASRRKRSSGLASAIGRLGAQLLLGVVFLLVLTPVALARRLGRRLPRDRTFRDASRESHWLHPDQPRSLDHYERPG